MSATTLNTGAFSIGQKVVWQDRPWSYGYEDGDIPAIVTDMTDKRVQIEFKPYGDTFARRRWIHPKNVFPFYD